MPRRRVIVMFVAAALFPLMATPARAKPRMVRLSEELRSAAVVTRARILSYEGSQLAFQPLPEPAEAMTATFSSTDADWHPAQLVRTEWPREAQDFTASWPSVGSEVLVVVDADHAVTLFAWPQGDRYRFWSSWMTGSVAIFNCEPPAEPLAGAALSTASAGEEWPTSSWDGCWYPASLVVMRSPSKTE